MPYLPLKRMTIHLLLGAVFFSHHDVKLVDSIVQISYILTAFIFTYPINYWKKNVVFRLCCCGSRVSSQIARFLPCTFEPTTPGNSEDFWSSFSAQLPSTQYLVWYLILVALAASTYNLYSYPQWDHCSLFRPHFFVKWFEKCSWAGS